MDLTPKQIQYVLNSQDGSVKYENIELDPDWCMTDYFDALLLKMLEYDSRLQDIDYCLDQLKRAKLALEKIIDLSDEQIDSLSERKIKYQFGPLDEDVLIVYDEEPSTPEMPATAEEYQEPDSFYLDYKEEW
jgi:hypothetical protein